MVNTCIITGYGINADNELKEAFELAGSRAEKVHINDIIDSPAILDNFQITAFPGGFSFGDHLGSGLVFAHLFKMNLQETLTRFVNRGNLIIGICNGFQVLVKMGVLPNLEGGWKQEVSLVHNKEGLFQDRWVNVETAPGTQCVWTKGIKSMELPIRHGEGRFIIKNESVRTSLREKGLIALKYAGENPNGSSDDIAGITDPTGRIFGLMPHPEAYVYPEHHPRWARGGIASGEGLTFFQNGVEYVKNREN